MDHVLEHKDGDPKRLFIVEGSDDFHFLGHWLDMHQQVDKCCFRAAGNDSKVLSAIPVLFKGSDLDSTAIIIDADSSARNRWEQVRQQLLRIEPTASLPTEPMSDGFILRLPDKPLFGCWIMPDNASTGFIESFASELVPDGDGLWPVAQSAVQAIPIDQRRFSAAHEEKAKLHTWLAWQQTPGVRIGLALRKEIITPEKPIGNKFQNWINQILD